MNFSLLKTDHSSSARAGIINTAHGNIETPVFMPVGTQATVKAVEQGFLIEPVSADIILANTYHLYLRPGTELLEKAGGVHKFMSWDRPLLTDSGGYQVYSLSDRRKITEEGAKFSSHIDGSTHLFTPENVMYIQKQIGADIIMAFDECTPYPCDYDYAKKSMHLTHRWLDRCIAAHDATGSIHGYEQCLAPIVQGSVYKDLRIASSEYVASKDMDINAIGGLSVGEPHDLLYEVCGICTTILPANKPRYLMGVGLPENILECISLGIDMFDCVLPTRNARHGLLYTWEGIINIKNAKWKDCFDPIDPESASPYSVKYSRSYLRHLFQVKEYLALQIASIHNLCFFVGLAKMAREKILDGSFDPWKNGVLDKLTKRL